MKGRRAKRIKGWKPQKHHSVIAWEEFINSDKGKGCLESFQGKIPPDQIQYLENRLWWAFRAGYNKENPDHTTSS